jgi:hypothetical protein
MAMRVFQHDRFNSFKIDLTRVFIVQCHAFDFAKNSIGREYVYTISFFLSFFIYLFITVQSVIIIIYTAIQIIRVIIIVLFSEVSTSRFY